MFSANNLFSKLKNIRNESETTRKIALWMMVFVCMLIVVGIWIITFMDRQNNMGKLLDINLKEYPGLNSSAEKFEELEKQKEEAFKNISYELEKAEAESKATQFLKANDVLSGLSYSDLKLIGERKEGNIWKLGYKQIYEGVPVEASNVEMTIIEQESGEMKAEIESKVVYPDIDIDINPKLTRNDALEKMKAENEIGETVEESSELVIFTLENKKNLQHRLAWKLHVKGKDLLFDATYFIDAASGKVLKRMEKGGE